MSVPSDLRSRAFDLPEIERLELAHELIASVSLSEAERDPEYEAAGSAEIKERYRRFQSGESKSIGAEEVMARLRERLQVRRSS